jgi:hypothetical protein
MQFIVYATDQNTAPGTPMTMEQLTALGQLMEESIKSGVLVTTGGVQPTGTRVRLSEGKFSVTDGPFIEAKELLGGFAVIRTNSLEEAIEYTKRFRSIVGDGESEIVRIYGPEDQPSS